MKQTKKETLRTSAPNQDGRRVVLYYFAATKKWGTAHRLTSGALEGIRHSDDYAKAMADYNARCGLMGVDPQHPSEQPAKPAPHSELKELLAAIPALPWLAPAGKVTDAKGMVLLVLPADGHMKLFEAEAVIDYATHAANQLPRLVEAIPPVMDALGNWMEIADKEDERQSDTDAYNALNDALRAARGEHLADDTEDWLSKVLFCAGCGVKFAPEKPEEGWTFHPPVREEKPIHLCADCIREFNSEKCTDLVKGVWTGERYYELQAWVEAEAKKPRPEGGDADELTKLRRVLAMVAHDLSDKAQSLVNYLPPETRAAVQNATEHPLAHSRPEEAPGHADGLQAEAEANAAILAHYVKAGGNCCPWCGSGDIEGGHIDINGTEAWQDCSCHKCEKQWRDVYKLTLAEVR